MIAMCQTCANFVFALRLKLLEAMLRFRGLLRRGTQSHKRGRESSAQSGG
jgi:hypothetical protein